MLTLRFPLHIEIKITNACNLRCIHCISNSGLIKKNELTKEEIFRIIDEAKKNKAFTIGITGGEPFLRKDVFEIIDYIFKKRLNIIITTNGTLLDKAIIEKIKNKISLLRVSLDHFNHLKHDIFRGIPGAYEKTFKILDFLKRYESYFQIVILTVVSRYNFGDLASVIKHFEESGFKAVNFFLFVSGGRGKKMEKELELDKKEVFKFCNFIKNQKKKRKIKILTDNPLMSIIWKKKIMRLCPAAITSCFITENGRVLPCPYFYSFKNYNDNIRFKTIKKIWDNSPYFKNLRKTEYLGYKCKMCHFKFSCFGGCRAGAFNKYKTIKKPDPMCWL